MTLLDRLITVLIRLSERLADRRLRLSLEERAGRML